MYLVNITSRKKLQNACQSCSVAFLSQKACDVPGYGLGQILRYSKELEGLLFHDPQKSKKPLKKAKKLKASCSTTPKSKKPSRISKKT